ncbi:MAG: epoxyqueuosine reductase QueH [Coriobacteriia bacterium]|nr:epoxyqueuosine reductase QueH [Coriobacteriia bacterium]
MNTEPTLTPESLALHTCCGPCLIEPLRLLRDEFDTITAVYFNPNIHPCDEYERRLATCAAYAISQDVAFIELEYQQQAWMQATADTSLSPQRCEQCYRLRFERVIKWAVERGSTHFATTLTVSPYQNQALIEKVAEELCERYGLVYAGRDFSDRYREATRLSREIGMYRQNYCGCGPSQQEARQMREQRKKRA